ncbi:MULTISPECIES: peptidoglycan endopeptidase [unclassified Mycolicibacterium]|uniref:peptidoglycan endopeptidase n=1 Tax=unclassified Mycolicibacterium TaxID=2636767 RepID=UPI0012DDB422|nr:MULTISPECIES: peptidoglycan endopeptidase [unclassified Mycolicibacterium]MUL85557.1 NlpC/P60 family protein [Mycolicibacterium sp. CBMA 329]MUL88679.1 NlpC/P60 family protein [Mycolicibacterium sp. CBMA 331]MUM02026.1 NlpC/P60 family protein [Mycolicibacterium sp. CBMA 334]MUM26931.1 NlpC/P60 family protein [Mycolicibacterium sp. CBMA 295]MUM40326.1 NlpC/P60 family protein [Mycolicibacterium sp. CBMA 247]
MFAIATLMALVQQVSGTPYISGGDSPAGTDCSGLASWVSNMATGRPVYGDRFSTGNQEGALLARGFKYGTQPGALVIGWNSGHTAVTLPDGTPVSSGEGGGVKVGGGGAYQRQFSHHMYLPVAADAPQEAPAPFDAAPPPPAPIDMMAAPAPMDPFAPPPVDPMAAPAPMDPFAPPPAADAIPPVDPMEAPAPIVLDVPPPPAPPAPEEPAPIAV